LCCTYFIILKIIYNSNYYNKNKWYNLFLDFEISEWMYCIYNGVCFFHEINICSSKKSSYFRHQNIFWWKNEYGCAFGSSKFKIPRSLKKRWVKKCIVLTAYKEIHFFGIFLLFWPLNTYYSIIYIQYIYLHTWAVK